MGVVAEATEGLCLLRLTSAPKQLKIPTTLTGTSLFTQRPRAFLPRANTNGISCSRAMAMTLQRASSRPPETERFYFSQFLNEAVSAKAKDTAAKESMNAWAHSGYSTHFPIYGYRYLFSFSPIKYHIPIMPVFLFLHRDQHNRNQISIK